MRVRPDLGETHLELARYYFQAGDSTTGHVTSCVIARRTLPNKFRSDLNSGPNHDNRPKPLGRCARQFPKGEANWTHATVRPHLAQGDVFLRCAATESANNS